MWDDAWENIVVFLPTWYEVDTEILLKGEYGMKGSVRLKGKTWSYRIDLGKVDGCLLYTSLPLASGKLAPGVPHRGFQPERLGANPVPQPHLVQGLQ